MINVTSELVKGFEHSKDVLTVYFKDGSIYDYQKIPLKLATLLTQISQVETISFGSAFHFLIKVPKYEFKKRDPMGG